MKFIYSEPRISKRQKKLWIVKKKRKSIQSEQKKLTSDNGKYVITFPESHLKRYSKFSSIVEQSKIKHMFENVQLCPRVLLKNNFVLKFCFL